MNVDKIMQAVSVNQEVAAVFGNMPEHKKECIEAALYFQLVNLYLMEFAKNLLDGMEPYDACIATAQGKMKLSDMGVSDSQITLFNLLAHKGNKE